LETAIIIKREETMAGQDKWYGKAWTVCQLIWKCSHRIHPRTSGCKQALLQGDPLLSMQFNETSSFLYNLKLKRQLSTWESPSSSLHSTLIWSRTMWFLFLSLLERKTMWASTLRQNMDIRGYT
jgi:hypothetical protein